METVSSCTLWLIFYFHLLSPAAEEQDKLIPFKSAIEIKYLEGTRCDLGVDVARNAVVRNLF